MKKAYILEGDPKEVEKVIRENRIRVSRGVISFTPVDTEAEAESDEPTPLDDKTPKADDAKEAGLGDDKAPKADDSKDVPAADAKEAKAGEKTKRTKK